MHLGEKLKLYRKAKDLDQPQMAVIVGVAYRTYQEIERTGIITKTRILQKVNDILEGKEQKIADDTQEIEEQEADSDPMSIIANLTVSNRMLAQATLILAKKINSNASAGASQPSQPTKPLLPDPTGGLKGKPDTDFDEKEGKRKDTLGNSGK